jgi:hypothetical protein
MPSPLNYATSYLQALEQAFPYVLNFGALYATPNNGRFRWVNSKTIEIPSISTTGRVDSNRDTVSFASRNYDNAWESKTLSNQRKWSTLVHPMDIDQTNLATTIQNITQVYNDEQKFPEMDAYTVSKIYADWVTAGGTADTTEPTAANILSLFDSYMQAMDEGRVPPNGRLLYCTYAIRTLLKSAQGLSRSIDVQNANSTISRAISRLDEVEIIGVPSELMKTVYDFTIGWQSAATAKQINMFLVHPGAVITPVSYTFSQLDEPSAGSEGKYVYFEESFEDVFILAKKKAAIMFNIASAATGLTVTSAAGTATGDTAVTVTGMRGNTGDALYAKTGLAVIPTNVGEVITKANWTNLATNPDDITPTSGDVIVTVVELDSSNRVVKSGSDTITVKT